MKKCRVLLTIISLFLFLSSAADIAYAGGRWVKKNGYTVLQREVPQGFQMTPTEDSLTIRGILTPPSGAQISATEVAATYKWDLPLSLAEGENPLVGQPRMSGITHRWQGENEPFNLGSNFWITCNDRNCKKYHGYIVTSVTRANHDLTDRTDTTDQHFVVPVGKPEGAGKPVKPLIFKVYVSLNGCTYEAAYEYGWFPTGGGTGGTTPATTSWAGTWSTSSGVLTLRQSNGHVTGEYVYPDGSPYGRVTGMIQGNSVKGTWWQSAQSRSGVFTFTLSPDGKSFAGTWEENQAGGKLAKGVWNGSR